MNQYFHLIFSITRILESQNTASHMNQAGTQTADLIEKYCHSYEPSFIAATCDFDINLVFRKEIKKQIIYSRQVYTFIII